MKIQMLTHEFPPFRGGIGTYASQLAMAAHQIGHEVTVVAPDCGQDLRRQDKTTYPFEIERYRASTYNYRKLPGLLWRTWSRSTRPGFDLVHAVDPCYTMALAFVGHFKQVDFVATAFGTEILSLRTSKQASFLRTGDLFDRASAVYAISEFTKSLLKRHCPRLEMSRVIVTKLGVDPCWFKSGDDLSATRREYRIPENHKVILTVARLDERKGHVTVLKAIAELSDELKTKLTYVIVGSGIDTAYTGKLRHLAATCGANVLFVANVSDEDLRRLYGCADVYCMPGESHAQKVEGFGLVYLEAAAQGLPSIGSRIGAVPEVVCHEETGLLIEPGNVTECAQCLTRLLSNAVNCRTLGEKARKWAKSFSWRRCAELTYGTSDSAGRSIRNTSIDQ